MLVSGPQSQPGRSCSRHCRTRPRWPSAMPSSSGHPQTRCRIRRRSAAAARRNHVAGLAAAGGMQPAPVGASKPHVQAAAEVGHRRASKRLDLLEVAADLPLATGRRCGDLLVSAVSAALAVSAAAIAGMADRGLCGGGFGSDRLLWGVRCLRRGRPAAWFGRSGPRRPGRSQGLASASGCPTSGPGVRRPRPLCASAAGRPVAGTLTLPRPT
jgi:hypothetical protein